MKKSSALLLIAALLFSALPAFAGSIEVKEDGTREGIVNSINLSTGVSGSKSGTTYTIVADLTDITSATFEGTTADAFETTLTVVDPTADRTFTLPDDDGYAMFSTLATNKTQVANSVWFISNGMVLEGATADAFETTLVPTDVTADATITLPTKTGTLHASGAATALTPGATPTLTVVAGRHTVTYQPADNTDATFNASGVGSAGDVLVFIFTTDAAGSGDEVMTFGTNMISTGTLTMANLAADVYTVSFISDGSKWCETGRTAVQTT